MSGKIKAWRTFWQLFMVANWFIILAFWWQNSSGDFLSGELALVLIALGRVAGLTAAYAILLQFFFMGRLPFLEKAFGLDKLSQLHQTNGKIGILLLLVHPILITLGYSILLGTSPVVHLKTMLTSSWHIAFAAIGTILFATVVVTSLVIIRRRFRYESWYFVHLLAYLAVFFSFFHQIELGHTLTSSEVFYGYWIALYVIVFANHLVFRFGRPIYNFLRHDFRVARIVRESPTTVSVYISGNGLQKFPVRPGQFMIFRFFTKKLWWQAHPFSLSMMPNGKEIRITVKELGDFTKAVRNIAIGTRVLIDGPYGVFTSLFANAQKTLFIAGGIGITPIRSLSEEMLKKGNDAVIIYANRNQSEIVFKSELDRLQSEHSLKVFHILSNEPNFEGEKGYVDEEKLKRLVPDFTERDVFLCGPPPMMAGLIKTLRSLGLSKSQIHFEKFSF